jgi:hypothetical protein
MFSWGVADPFWYILYNPKNQEDTSISLCNHYIHNTEVHTLLAVVISIVCLHSFTL